MRVLLQRVIVLSEEHLLRTFLYIVSLFKLSSSSEEHINDMAANARRCEHLSSVAGPRPLLEGYLDVTFMI